MILVSSKNAQVSYFEECDWMKEEDLTWQRGVGAGVFTLRLLEFWVTSQAPTDIPACMLTHLLMEHLWGSGIFM